MNFKVTLKPSGHWFEVADGTPILTAGLATGHYLPHSCRQAHCGSCKARIVGGQVDHGDVSESDLTPDERREGLALLCRATARSDVVIEVEEVDGLEGLRTTIVPCRVVSIDKASRDVAILRVRLPMNENMMFVAGQYVDFILPDGLRRSYSIAVPPSAEGARELEFHLKRLPGGKFTENAFTVMKPRDILKFEGPLGTFVLRKDDKPIILIATGTGFSPIKAMLMQMFQTGTRNGREVRFYWGGRTLEDFYMFDLVTKWAEDQDGFSFIPVLSGAAALPEGAVAGHVHEAVLRDVADLSGHQVYACGSPAMVASARRAFCDRGGLHPDSFCADEFLPATDNAALNSV